MPARKRCIVFVKTLCKVKGLSYRKMIEKYPRGPYKDSVYGPKSKIIEGHCVYCARADAIADFEKSRKKREPIWTPLRKR